MANNPYVNRVQTADGTTIIDISDTTAVASDVASGKYFYDASGAKVQGTGSGGSGGIVITDTADSHGGTVRTITAVEISGTKQITANGTGIDVTEFAAVDVAVPTGGGASNFVKGTFKGTTTGTAMDINVPYSGNGYPVALLIAPTEGPANSNTGTFYNTLKRYACAMFFAMKDRADAVPSYSGAVADAYTGISRYKNSSSNATTQTNSNISNNPAVCDDTDASGTGASSIVRIRAKNKISVYIAGTSYGFMANIEYTYHIIYSE